ncbi:MAG: hypothetical protein NTX01_08625 [Candidatus Omnitrophica bacterium]|nr:hypothetical protein [Candidatus Omnitrophota bacterium]
MTEIASAPAVPRKDEQKKLSWKDSLPTQRLLNVICSILAEEYIMIAKQNLDVFAECRMSIPPPDPSPQGGGNMGGEINRGKK